MDDLLKMQLRLEFYQDNLNFWKQELENYKERKQECVKLIKESGKLNFVSVVQRDALIKELVEKDIENFEQKIKSIEKEIGDLKKACQENKVCNFGG